MCGIAAVWRERDGEAALLVQLASLAHRGDRHRGAEYSGSDSGWFLGTRRLAVTSAEGESQPARSPRGRYLLAFNGELFNYRDEHLFRNQPGIGDRQSDTEVLAAAFEAFGIRQTLSAAIWEGAIIVLDTLTQQVTITRDHLGIKPLYWSAATDGVTIASEMKALCAPKTVKTVHTVPPGRLMTFGRDGSLLGTEEWWSVTAPHASQCAKRDQGLTRFRSSLAEAVQNRVPAESPYAVMLSGGIDSSAVLKLAVESGRRPEVFTLAKQGSQDLPYARQLCKELGLVLHEVLAQETASSDEILHDTVEAVESWHWQVLTHSAPMFPLMEAIRQTGIKVVLAGEGADELFGGYHRDVSTRQFKDERFARLRDLHRTNCQRLDRMGSMHQLEIRVPFLDRALVELILGFPAEWMTGGLPKQFLRDAMAGLLPSSIIDRKKLSFAKGVGYRYGPTHSEIFSRNGIERLSLESPHEIERSAKQIFSLLGFGKAIDELGPVI